MNVLIVAEPEEVRKLRSYMEMETVRNPEINIRCFSEETCAGALERISMNPYLYGILFIGRIITDHSDRTDAQVIQHIYSMNPRILICMSTSKTFLSYEFCSIPCICTIRHPFSREQIRSMLKRMSRIERIRYGDPAFRIPVYHSDGVTMIPAVSIRYARKVRNGIVMITECGSFINRRRMDTFEKNAGKLFIRCHGSYIVNLSHVIALRGNQLEMDDGERIPVSRTYLNEVRTCLNTYHIFIVENTK